MYLDKQTRLSDAQALTATAATTNYYDQTDSGNLGDGEPMAMVYTVVVAADFTTGDETYAFAIQTDDNTSFSSAATISSVTVAAGTLVAGYQVVLPIPPGVGERYTRGYMTLAGTTPTISVDCDIVPLQAVPKHAIYPAGYTIT